MDILPGEEISYSYGEEYWEFRKKIAYKEEKISFENQKRDLLSENDDFFIE